MTSRSSCLIINCIFVYVFNNLSAVTQLDKRMELRLCVCTINGPLTDYIINVMG